MKEKLKIFAIPGSLRAGSSNHAVVSTVAKMLPPHAELTVYDGLGKLPHFDGDEDPPATVIEFRNKLREADGVIICSPEYAFGVPGSLKNALDWTVSSGEFTGKPTALITAATGGEKAHAAWQLILSALDAKLEKETTLLVPFVRAKLKDGEVSDAATLKQLQDLVNRFIEMI